MNGLDLLPDLTHIPTTNPNFCHMLGQSRNLFGCQYTPNIRPFTQCLSNNSVVETPVRPCGNRYVNSRTLNGSRTAMVSLNDWGEVESCIPSKERVFRAILVPEILTLDCCDALMPLSFWKFLFRNPTPGVPWGSAGGFFRSPPKTVNRSPKNTF